MPSQKPPYYYRVLQENVLAFRVTQTFQEAALQGVACSRVGVAVVWNAAHLLATACK